jgi:Zn-dependent protease with chaperone function
MSGFAATPAAEAAVDGMRSALIVASDDYSDPGLRRLHAPAADAHALTAVLEDPEIGGFQVRTLLNQPAHEVSLAVEEFFADRRPDDLLLLHVSCHGVKDEGGELYFATANTRLRRLGSTAVAADFVNRLMNRSRSRRVVLLLDCCYAGAFERGMTARAGVEMGIEEQFGGLGRAVITASSAMEYAFEGDQLADTQQSAPSVFTSALVEGLETGEADRDQDGLVGLDELYDYIFDKVRAATPNQTPGKWTFGVQGELVIARRARPVTTPAPLPSDVQELIGHRLATARAGAVQELAHLVRSHHAGVALAARLALEGLTEDDSRIVSAAATAALGAQDRPVAPEPAPSRPEPEPAPPPATLDEPERVEAIPLPAEKASHSTTGDAATTRTAAEAATAKTAAARQDQTERKANSKREPRTVAARVQEQAADNRRAYQVTVAVVVTALALFGLLVTLALGFGVSGLGAGLVLAVLVVGFAPGRGERSALRDAGARSADPARWPRYHNLVQGLSQAAGLPMPRLYMVDSDAANAFSVGRRPDVAMLVVTSGLIGTLNKVELEGVLAHELAHVQSGGARLATLGIALQPLRGLTAPHRRELDADEGAVRLTHNPSGLASALGKLGGGGQPPGGRAIRHLWIVAPEDATRPTVEDRIAALGDL